MTDRPDRIFGSLAPEEELDAPSPPAAVGLLRTPAPAAEEGQRVIRRSRVLLHGKIVYDGARFSTDCVIRDLSERGAKVRLPAQMILPDSVHLIDTRSGAAYQARIAWRRGSDLGLELLGRHELNEASTPELRLMRKMWIEHLSR